MSYWKSRQYHLNHSKLVSAVCYWVMALLLLVAATSPTLAETKQRVKIGVILPISGNAALYGIDALRILRMLQPIFNKRSAHYQYEYIIEEGQCGVGHAAIDAAQKLININQVKFIIAGCSGEVLQIAPLLESQKVVGIGFAASHPDIKNAGDFVFRTYADVETGVAKLVKVIEQRRLRKVAILTEEMSFTEGVRRALLANLKDRVALDETFKPGETDFRSLLLRASAARPDALYLNAGTPATYQPLLKQLKELGIEGALFSYFQPSEESSIKNLGMLQEGIVYISIPENISTNPDFNSLVQQYQRTFKEDVQHPALAQSSYNAAISLFDSIEAVGPDAPKVKDYLYKYEGQGAYGPLKYDGNGDLLDVSMGLQTIRNGRVAKF